jgi:UDP-N-acetylglucosamine 2-epimerase (non-hydrolysing)
MHITLIAGARPNFMKIAPIIDQIKKAQKDGRQIDFSLVHTGQHYDKKLSQDFFDELNIPKPDANLSVGSGSHAKQTAAIMVAFEEFLVEHPTDLVLVVGDINSTMAATLVAKKMNIKVAHVEAGIRSFDLTMPEEINRMVTDAICDYFFVTSRVAIKNLKHNGIKDEQIFFVGNTMIDTLLHNKNRFKQPIIFDSLQLKDKEYLVSTLHRPSNVDEPENLQQLMLAIGSLDKIVVFPCHPRTKAKLESISAIPENLKLVDPLSYLEFMYLIERSFAVITDSGGITEETTVLGIPCMTLRENTERPETVELGTNQLLGTNPKAIQPAYNELLKNNNKKGQIPELWDGKTSERIIDILLQL